MPAFWKKLYDDSWGVMLKEFPVARVGDIVTVVSKDNVSTDVRLTSCLIDDGWRYSLWRAELATETPAAKPGPPVQARKPMLRKKGQLLRVPRLPVLSPEPPPHTDADAPPPEDE